MRYAALVLAAMALFAPGSASAATADGLHNDRYCEFLVLKGSLPNITVDVWNSLTIVSPEDPDAEVERLRERYGDALGTIDLRR